MRIRELEQTNDDLESRERCTISLTTQSISSYRNIISVVVAGSEDLEVTLERHVAEKVLLQAELEDVKRLHSLETQQLRDEMQCLLLSFTI